jgi:hypothetical protein
MPPKTNDQHPAGASQKSANASKPLRTTASVETKTNEHSPIRQTRPAAAPVSAGPTIPPAQRRVQANAPESGPGKSAITQATVAAGRQGKGNPTDTGFLPHAPRVQDVANLLSKHMAEHRGESPDAVLGVYKELEPGFHLVFKRELCLKHDDLNANDHKGKRPLRITGYERLVQAAASSGDALKVLARLLEKGRIEAVKAANKADKGRHATKPLVVNVSKLVADVKKSHQNEIELRPNGPEMEALWRAPLTFCLDRLEEIRSLKDPHMHQRLGLKRPLSMCAFLGGGGGSDVVQAAALAKLFGKANPIMKVLAVISIRTLYSKSTSAGEKRSVWHGSDKSSPKSNLLDGANGDLKIEPYHRGNARFVEDAIAGDFQNVRLVIDDKSQDKIRRPRYEGALGKEVDSMVIIDTGGDVLGGMDSSAPKKTPDQDCRTQLATAQIAAARDLDAIVAIAALGVDAPSDAQRKLEASDAVYYKFTAEDKKYLTALYERWHFNGSPTNLKKFPERYGKTPFAMLASFKLKPDERAFHALPLPESVINDFSNPWACITWVTPEMSCLVLANQAKLLSVIAPAKKN